MEPVLEKNNDKPKKMEWLNTTIEMRKLMESPSYLASNYDKEMIWCAEVRGISCSLVVNRGNNHMALKHFLLPGKETAKLKSINLNQEKLGRPEVTAMQYIGQKVDKRHMHRNMADPTKLHSVSIPRPDHARALKFQRALEGFSENKTISVLNMKELEGCPHVNINSAKTSMATEILKVHNAVGQKDEVIEIVVNFGRLCVYTKSEKGNRIGSKMRFKATVEEGADAENITFNVFHADTTNL